METSSSLGKKGEAWRANFPCLSLLDFRVQFKVSLKDRASRLQLLKQLIYSHRVTFSSNVSDSLL